VEFSWFLYFFPPLILLRILILKLLFNYNYESDVLFLLAHYFTIFAARSWKVAATTNSQAATKWLNLFVPRPIRCDTTNPTLELDYPVIVQYCNKALTFTSFSASKTTPDFLFFLDDRLNRHHMVINGAGLGCGPHPLSDTSSEITCRTSLTGTRLPGAFVIFSKCMTDSLYGI
jgi:hypothetical protein